MKISQNQTENSTCEKEYIMLLNVKRPMSKVTTLPSLARHQLLEIHHIHSAYLFSLEKFLGNFTFVCSIFICG